MTYYQAVAIVPFSQFIKETMTFPVAREQPRDLLPGRGVVIIPMR